MQYIASLTRSSALAAAFACAFACYAQMDLPTISRMCLWNGDRHTWSELGLKRYQIKQVEAIRERYPAVVGAQWLNEDLLEPDRDRIDSTGAMTTGQSHGDASKNEKTGLQAELRNVLTADQLRQWSQLCPGPDRMGRVE